MKAFETLDQLTTPDGRRLTLHHRDGDYFVYLDGEELMSTRAPGSERALAELACEGLGERPRVLIGGLGLLQGPLPRVLNRQLQPFYPSCFLERQR